MIGTGFVKMHLLKTTEGSRLQSVPPRTRSLARNSFGLDIEFMNVTDESHPIFCSNPQALGAANEEGLFIRQEALDLSNNELDFIILHEMAHLVQKYNGLLSDRYSAKKYLECEANIAACKALLGESITIRGIDKKECARFYDEDGHYYTTYLAACLGGLNSWDAFRIAFYSQLPDLVWELDATSVALYLSANEGVRFNELPESWNLSQRGLDFNVQVPLSATVATIALDNAWSKEAYSRENPSHLERSLKHKKFYKREYIEKMVKRHDYSGAVRKTILDARTFCADVQLGLHCITNNLASFEQKVRENRLFEFVNYSKHALKLGLAIHAYADSFAHVRIHGTPERMYSFPTGHLDDDHEPDMLVPDHGNSSKRFENYQKFFRQLVKFFCICTNRSAPMSDRELNQFIIAVKIANKKLRVDTFKQLIDDNCNGTQNDYDPPTNADFWYIVRERENGHLSLSADDLTTALSCARKWRLDQSSSGTVRSPAVPKKEKKAIDFYPTED